MILISQRFEYGIIRFITKTRQWYYRPPQLAPLALVCSGWGLGEVGGVGKGMEKGCGGGGGRTVGWLLGYWEETRYVVWWTGLVEAKKDISVAA